MIGIFAFKELKRLRLVVPRLELILTTDLENVAFPPVEEIYISYATKASIMTIAITMKDVQALFIVI
jgi:hypothetical protein